MTWHSRKNWSMQCSTSRNLRPTWISKQVARSKWRVSIKQILSTSDAWEHSLTMPTQSSSSHHRRLNPPKHQESKSQPGRQKVTLLQKSSTPVQSGRNTRPLNSRKCSKLSMRRPWIISTRISRKKKGQFWRVYSYRSSRSRLCITWSSDSILYKVSMNKITAQLSRRRASASLAYFWRTTHQSYSPCWRRPRTLIRHLSYHWLYMCRQPMRLSQLRSLRKSNRWSSLRINRAKKRHSKLTRSTSFSSAEWSCPMTHTHRQHIGSRLRTGRIKRRKLQKSRAQSSSIRSTSCFASSSSESAKTNLSTRVIHCRSCKIRSIKCNTI